MNETRYHPYSLEIIAPPNPGGSFHWAIRKAGKLVQRSDRSSRTEDEARKKGEAEIERMFQGVQSDR